MLAFLAPIRTAFKAAKAVPVVAKWGSRLGAGLFIVVATLLILSYVYQKGAGHERSRADVARTEAELGETQSALDEAIHTAETIAEGEAALSKELETISREGDYF